MKLLKPILLSVIAILLCTTCSKDDPGTPSGNVSNVFDVTFTDQTVYIDSTVVKSLIRMDTADYIYYFKSSEPKIANLKADDILLIHGLALRRV
ncbi:MAG: hypothetical protein NTV01_11890 [Bacteroidia bacterium]|nr:hypothetical protein [Bacteroidia bacterium]